MADYRVNLEIFAGPLDLLLYLVRKDEVDIYDIQIAKITDQYISYIEMLKSFDIDMAGDFLVMAATLMQIKSAMLLPKDITEGVEGEDLEDPRTELIRQLLEYKKFKDAANLLDAVADKQQQRYPRSDNIIEKLKPDTEPMLDLEQVSVWDLLEAFDNILKATGSHADYSYISDDTPIDLYQIEILHRLQGEGPMSFERVFESRSNRHVMIGLFLALLELTKSGLITAEQSEGTSSIFLRALTEEPAEQAVQNAIIAAIAEEDANQQSEVQDQHQPPIPIEQLPAKSKPAAVEPASTTDTPIPIVELPASKEQAPTEQELQNNDELSSQQT